MRKEGLKEREEKPISQRGQQSGRKGQKMKEKRRKSNKKEKKGERDLEGAANDCNDGLVRVEDAGADGVEALAAKRLHSLIFVTDCIIDT